MCGIVGSIGRRDCLATLLEGLARVEYRGYDSAGVAVITSHGLKVCKREGKLRVLEGAVPKRLSGKVGIAPRLFLKKLVSDVLDRIDQFDDFDPTQHYQLTVTSSELTTVEREAQAVSVDDIELDT